jgi:integrase
MSEKWSYSAGTAPHTVAVYEREAGGILYARAWDSKARNGKGSWKRVSLGHRDRAKAKRYATKQAAQLQSGEVIAAPAKLTLAGVTALYLEHRTPRKSASQQAVDAREAEMWIRVLGADSDPYAITLRQWEAFIDARSSGAIDARGRTVPAGRRSPVRARTVEASCEWLRFLFNWAVRWRLEETGRYLMSESPVRGYASPTEKNPRRVVASTEYFDSVRAAAEHVTMELNHGKQDRTPSYLPEILDIAEGTGRRITAILSLRFSDIIWERTRTAPHGAILWPGETDKGGKEWVAPVTAAVRNALDRVLRARPGIGNAYLFPAMRKPSRPLSRSVASEWLQRAEELAGLPRVDGRGWHSLRRKWATERKHLPDVDVAAAGGWRSLQALKQSYQHADEEGVLAVVLGGGQLREMR